MAFPLLAGKIVDIAAKHALFSANVYTIAIYIAIFVVLQAIFSYARVYFFSVVSEQGTADIRKAVFKRMIHLPLSYFQAARSGDLLSRLTTDVSLVQQSFAVTLVEFIRQVAVVCAGLLMVFSLAPILGIALLFGAPILAFFVVYFGRKIRGYTRFAQNRYGAVNSVADEAIQLIKTIKAFGSEPLQQRKYTALQNEAVAMTLRVARVKAFLIAAIIFVLLLSILGVIGYGASLVQQGVMSTGDLFSFILYAMLVVGSVMGLGDVYSQLQQAIGASQRLSDILQQPIEQGLLTIFTPKAYPFSFRDKDIVFSGVSFSYPSRPNKPALSAVDLRIAAGAKVAVMGHNGAGKSTLLQLLLRFYTPTAGAFTVGGVASTAYSLNEWRQQIGIIPQEVMLFSGSIEENIRYGRIDASAEAVERVVREAHVWEFASQFPEGLRTQVGEKGMQLSGGQRQRIGIARMMLRAPSLVLLDEAVTFLDNRATSLVQECLKSFLASRTAVMVTHKMPTALAVDYVYCLEKGRVVRSGNLRSHLGC